MRNPVVGGAVGGLVIAAAFTFTAPALADPDNPDPFSPADCTANASAVCDTGPYGPDSPTNPDSPTDPLSPLNPDSPTNIDNPANPMSPMNPDNPANPMSPMNPANPAGGI